MKIQVGISNRHIHLNDMALKQLFGPNFQLEKDYPLNQPGQFASTSFLTIKTDKDEIRGVRIIGPTRSYTQIEISKTDSYKLGIDPPIRLSGDLEGSETVTLMGPKGQLTTNGCIIPNRHIHITKKQKEEYSLPDIVKVKVTGPRGGILDNVHCIVSDQSYFELHIDTDEANALQIKDSVEIIDFK